MNYKKACGAKTKTGKPCGAAPTSGGLCFFHSNPAKASELGRLGGLRNRRLTNIGTPTFFTSEVENFTRHRLAALYDDVFNGRIRPAAATVLLKVTELQLKLEEKTAIAKIEKQLQDLKDIIMVRDIESEAANPFSEDAQDDNDGLSH